jgi:iron complex outermembrane recepter protein
VQTPLQMPHPQRGDPIDLAVDERTVGARGSARARGSAWGRPQDLELGYFARADAVSGIQQRIEAATDHPYHTDTDLDSRLTDIGLYADAALRPWWFLTLRGGVRADLFTFDVDDRCAVDSVSHPSSANPPGDASCLDQEAFGAHREPNQRATTGARAVLPRASALVGPFRGVTLSTSYGVGARSVDPGYVTQDIKTPFATVRAVEAGVAYTHAGRDIAIAARSVAFQTHVDRDLIFSETAGRNLLGAGTTRAGWLAAARISGGFFDQSINLTLTRSTFDDTHLLVPYVPDRVLRSDTALWKNLPAWLGRGRSARANLALGVSYVGPRALPYGQRGDALLVVDGSAGLGWSRYEFGLSATNLLDRRYRLSEFNYASDFRGVPGATPTLVPVRHFTAGAPRALFFTLSVNLGAA